MRTTHLRNLTVSALGLGCMGMSEGYGPTDWDASIATIRHAISIGVTLIDTADMYGSGHNEVLVGRAITSCRDDVQLATKFGVDRSGGNATRTFRGDAAYVARSCDASLLRLGVDVIDLYYLHRPPQNVAIEETIEAMAKLVGQGKVRYLGLSEVDATLLRRAHAVHPITAVQSEYSLWTRNVEDVIPAMRELGVGLVAYSPLGRGFLTGSLDVTRLDPGDTRSIHGRFQADAAKLNERIVDTIRDVAHEREITPAQVALSWVLSRSSTLGLPVVPIPGTRSSERLEENAGAVGVFLNDETLARLDTLADLVVGDRHGRLLS